MSAQTEAMAKAARRFAAILPRYLTGETNAGARKLLGFVARDYATDPAKYVAESQARAIRFVVSKIAWTDKGWHALDEAIERAGLAEESP